MLAYSSPLQEGKPLRLCISALILISGGLLGQWITEAKAGPISGQAADPGFCPTIHRYIPRESKAFIPIPHTRGYAILCRVNASSSHCEWVMVSTRGRAYYFNMDLKDHLILHSMGLIVTRMTKDLEGEYQVLSGINRTCEGRILITAVGSLFLYRIFLLIPGITFLCGLSLLWDWLIKARNQLATSEEEQRNHERIQHIIAPSDLSNRDP
ncbi:Maltose/maltodextrin import ATP-binding protein MalK [Varanus komodoensis]|nr:Maltose/maltodextrin import ATP-binding protein MalK [Varanus komodoensis]